MKGCLVIAGVFAAMAAAFVGVVVWGAERGSDADAAFTQAVRSDVVDSKPEDNPRQAPRTGLRVQYRYWLDGQGYASDAWVAQATWEEFGAEVRICWIRTSPLRTWSFSDPLPAAATVTSARRGRSALGGSDQPPAGTEASGSPPVCSTT